MKLQQKYIVNPVSMKLNYHWNTNGNSLWNPLKKMFLVILADQKTEFWASISPRFSAYSVDENIKSNRITWQTDTWAKSRLPINLWRGQSHPMALHARHRHLVWIKAPYRPLAWALNPTLTSHGITRQRPTPCLNQGSL